MCCLGPQALTGGERVNVTRSDRINVTRSDGVTLYIYQLVIHSADTCVKNNCSSA